MDYLMLSLVRMPGKWCVQLIAVTPMSHSTYPSSCLFLLKVAAALWITHAGVVLIFICLVCCCRRVCRRHLLFGLPSWLQMGAKVDCAWNWAGCMCVPVPVIADMLFTHPALATQLVIINLEAKFANSDSGWQPTFLWLCLLLLIMLRC